MENYFLVSSCEVFLENYEKYIKNYKKYSKIHCIKIKDVVYADMHGMYYNIADALNKLSPPELRNATIIIDEFIELEKSNPIELSGNKNNFWGRIILAYPEVDIVFQQDLQDWRPFIINIKKNRFNPLFDFSGRRNLLKEKLLKKEPGFIQRTLKARIIEDEISCAFFHGYITYNHYYLTKLYTTLQHLNHDKELQQTDKSKFSVDIQLQDLSLGFIDKREDYNISDLKTRYSDYPFLKLVEITKDFIITTGPNDDTENFKNHLDYEYNENDETCESTGLPKSAKNEFKPIVKFIFKPTKGMYDIEKKLGLGVYACKQEISTTTTTTTTTKGHSAHGILAFIAERLIERATNILNQATNVVDAIHAATLALEAKELLNGLTPTLGLQALTIQQKAEVTAECLFSGTEYNLNLDGRFKEIENEVTIITKPYFEKIRTALNAQLSIIEALSGVFASNKQFEEELSCLHKATELSLNLYFPKIPQSISKSVLKPVKSLRNFAITIFIIQIFFGVIYFAIHQIQNGNTSFNSQTSYETFITFLETLLASTKYFFTCDESEFSAQKIFKFCENWGTFVKGLQGFFALTSISLLMAMFLIRLGRK